MSEENKPTIYFVQTGRLRTKMIRASYKTEVVLKAAYEKLQQELDDLKSGALHTCHTNCNRVECVQRREIEKLRQELESVKAELQAALKENIDMKSTKLRERHAFHECKACKGSGLSFSAEIAAPVLVPCELDCLARKEIEQNYRYTLTSKIESELAAEKAKSKKLVEALEKIAQINGLKYLSIEKWPIEELITTIMYDTNIAKQALAEYRGQK
jgi:hypothetical protein